MRIYDARAARKIMPPSSLIVIWREGEFDPVRKGPMGVVLAAHIGPPAKRAPAPRHGGRFHFFKKSEARSSIRRRVELEQARNLDLPPGVHVAIVLDNIDLVAFHAQVEVRLLGNHPVAFENDLHAAHVHDVFHIVGFEALLDVAVPRKLKNLPVPHTNEAAEVKALQVLTENVGVFDGGGDQISRPVVKVEVRFLAAQVLSGVLRDINGILGVKGGDRHGMRSIGLVARLNARIWPEVEDLDCLYLLAFVELDLNGKAVLEVVQDPALVAKQIRSVEHSRFRELETLALASIAIAIFRLRGKEVIQVRVAIGGTLRAAAAVPAVNCIRHLDVALAPAVESFLGNIRPRVDADPGIVRKHNCGIGNSVLATLRAEVGEDRPGRAIILDRDGDIKVPGAVLVVAV
mmetsp:Transcript_19805/g.50050  ORF Transcript_19805/g.50050 Transcript_19805/m.50050 type:complete len:404 (+) Transcript_19805:141-1352(+)